MYLQNLASKGQYAKLIFYRLHKNSFFLTLKLGHWRGPASLHVFVSDGNLVVSILLSITLIEKPQQHTIYNAHELMKMWQGFFVGIPQMTREFESFITCQWDDDIKCHCDHIGIHAIIPCILHMIWIWTHRLSITKKPISKMSFQLHLLISVFLMDRKLSWK